MITGPQFQGFREAEDLVALGGISVVPDGEIFTERVLELAGNGEERKRQGAINRHYIADRKGATEKVMAYIREKLKA